MNACVSGTQRTGTCLGEPTPSREASGAEKGTGVRGGIRLDVLCFH